MRITVFVDSWIPLVAPPPAWFALELNVWPESVEPCPECSAIWRTTPHENMAWSTRDKLWDRVWSACYSHGQVNKAVQRKKKVEVFLFVKGCVRGKVFHCLNIILTGKRTMKMMLINEIAACSQYNFVLHDLTYRKGIGNTEHLRNISFRFQTTRWWAPTVLIHSTKEPRASPSFVCFS